jgi:hypothetical protein
MEKPAGGVEGKYGLKTIGVDVVQYREDATEGVGRKSVLVSPAFRTYTLTVPQEA